MTSSAGPAGLAALWNDRAARRLIYQGALLVIVLAALAFLWSNASANIARRGLELGFAFLGRTANFAIGESVVAYSPADSYGRALLVGLTNTLMVAAVGCLMTTVLGVSLGVMRLSSNPLLARLVGLYVELGRNVPLLLQLFFWYALCTRLSGPRQALSPLPGVFLSNRGLRMPTLVANDALALAACGLVVAALLGLALRLWAGRRQSLSGRRPRIAGWVAAAAVLAPLGAMRMASSRLAFDVPELQGFNFVGGLELSPEFVALLVGLTFYTTAFVTEIVRGGIAGVGKGQWEAAKALGLPGGRIMALVVLPQALRTIIPPLASQYMNLMKNSSLAIAIGFPDLINISNTVVNQTGQALEVIFLFMAAYLSINLTISGVMNWLNRRVAGRSA
ncbi:MAG: amino acid ABC transporter permease [Phreatobacter sp.]